ncbi:hypothetical protein E2C01_011951 [Portunus trituberculatus]|uniref:Uncharacterized protein n=1 Tax=Portunus trituberculatus TaxID=210409 RepID=A0A5B7DCQ1_PORTR|nr:hypothetical protein [Portunus trituberculatus]
MSGGRCGVLWWCSVAVDSEPLQGHVASATPRDVLPLLGEGQNGRLQDIRGPPAGLSSPVAEPGLGSDPPLTIPEVTVYDLGSLASLRNKFPFLRRLALGSGPPLAFPEVMVHDLLCQAGHSLVSLRNAFPLLPGLGLGSVPPPAILKVHQCDLGGEDTVRDLGDHAGSGVRVNSKWRQDELDFTSLGGQAGVLLSFCWFLLVLLGCPWLVQEPSAAEYGDRGLVLGPASAACCIPSFQAEKQRRAAPDPVCFESCQQVSQRDLTAGHKSLSRQDVHPDGRGTVLLGDLPNGHQGPAGRQVLACPVSRAGEAEVPQQAPATFPPAAGQTEGEAVGAATLAHHLQNYTLFISLPAIHSNEPLWVTATLGTVLYNGLILDKPSQLHMSAAACPCQAQP